jgi:hypothetical protein
MGDFVSADGVAAYADIPPGIYFRGRFLIVIWHEYATRGRIIGTL